MNTNYRRGADFERRVVKDLEGRGWSVVRSAGSHKPADVVAMLHGSTVCVQCKRDARLPPAEWNKFWKWCENGGATPVMASVPKSGRGIRYHLLNGTKEHRGKQPMEEWKGDTNGVSGT
jgi:Holliday junction resolvase